MIHSDERGQNMWQEVVRQYEVDPDFWSEFDQSFIKSNTRTSYKNFSQKQKAVVANLHEKLMKG